MSPIDDTVEQSDIEMVMLKVKTCDGKSFTLERLGTQTTVLDLKKSCAPASGVAAVHQRLFFKGRQLKDTETLREAKLMNNTTLFLTKAPSWKAELDKAPSGTVPCAGGCGLYGDSRTDNFCSQCFARQTHDERDRIWQGIFAEGETLEQEGADSSEDSAVTESAPLVVGAAVRIRGLQAAKELNGRLGYIVKYMEESSRFSVKLKGEEGTKAIKAANLKRLDDVTPLSASKVLVQRDTTRCWCCNKRVGLTGFSCRCGYVFCSRHRHAEDHECDFDHQRQGQLLLTKANPPLHSKQWELLDGL